MVLAALAAAVLGLVPFCFFIVDQAEYAVVTQFGEPVQVVTEPGLGLKYPFQSVNKFDRRLFVYAPPLSEFLTLEKTAVVASSDDSLAGRRAPEVLRDRVRPDRAPKRG